MDGKKDIQMHGVSGPIPMASAQPAKEKSLNTRENATKNPKKKISVNVESAPANETNAQDASLENRFGVSNNTMNQERANPQERAGQANTAYDRVLEDDLTTTARSHALLPAQRLALALQALASNSFQLIIGDIAGVSQPTVSRVIRQVCEVVSNKVDFFVNWPQGEELIDNYKKFKELTNIPKVVGAVDGTHVRIPAPKDDEHLFVNRKSYHSLNVGLACDFNLKFIWLSCRFGGSAHDSRVFRESGAHANLQAGNYEGVLLGDSAYRCESFLYKPILNPNSNAESRFTDALCRGRVKIENAIGCLKRQFHCLHAELRYTPDVAKFIVTGAVCFRNMAISLNEPPFDAEELDDNGGDDSDEEDNDYEDPNVPNTSGQNAMRFIIDTYFT